MATSDKMEQYLLLAKGMRGLALVDLITKATAEAGLFTFGELLALSAVEELKSGEHASAVSLLQLFAYGTWPDYVRQSSAIASLSVAQQRKLKVLTIASLAACRRTLPYQELMAQLDLVSIRELEDLIISDCIYTGVVQGRLDQRARCLHVEHALARDVPPEGLPQLIQSLDEWLDNAQQVMAGIEAQVQATGEAVAATEARRAARQKAAEAELSSVRAVLEARAQHDVAAMAMDEGDAVALGGEGSEGEAGPSGPRLTKRRR